ncbi:MAG: hypothetical protein M4579_002294 [Chaenotheca gracillima]|nr:MAG: hypothetical protein M4579_002294 [Chaenotheca gracillima]
MWFSRSPIAALAQQGSQRLERIFIGIVKAIDHRAVDIDDPNDLMRPRTLDRHHDLAGGLGIACDMARERGYVTDALGLARGGGNAADPAGAGCDVNRLTCDL